MSSAACEKYEGWAVFDGGCVHCGQPKGEHTTGAIYGARGPTNESLLEVRDEPLLRLAGKQYVVFLASLRDNCKAAQSQKVRAALENFRSMMEEAWDDRGVKALAKKAADSATG